MKTSPVQRSLKHLRDEGWTACVVEKWLPARGTMKFGRRIDAFGFADILACKEFNYKGTIALVQTTTRAHMNDHREKIFAIPEFHIWRGAGGTVLLHGWKKTGPRGKRKTWQVTEEVL